MNQTRMAFAGFLVASTLAIPAIALAELAPPAVVSQTPALSAHNVPLDGIFSITFTTALDPASIQPSSVRLWLGDEITGTQNPVEVTPTLSPDGLTVSLYPELSLQYATPFYFFEVVGGIPGVSVYPFGAPDSYIRNQYLGLDPNTGEGFTTGGVRDTVPPQVVSVSSDGQTFTNNVPTETIEIVFDKDISRKPDVTVDGTPKDPNGCNDHNYKTFCVTYEVPNGVQSPKSINISGARDASVQTMSPNTRSFAVDTLPPALGEVSPIGNTTDTTPQYQFSSTEAGSITYGGSCSSAQSVAVAGSNTISFNTLALGTYSNCTITVTDAFLNVSSPLAVSSFTIAELPPPPPPTTSPLVVTAESKVIILGAPLPSLTATLSGFKADDTAANSTTGSASCTTTATATSPVGSYPITCTKGTLASTKYTFDSFVAGTLRIIYRFDGFLQPINDTAHQIGQDLSVFKGGSTVPVKLQLKTTSGALVVAASAPQWLPPLKGSAMNAAVDEYSYSDVPTTGTVFKSTTDGYSYNWSTKGLTPGFWYHIFAKFDDGQIYAVTIGLR